MTISNINGKANAGKEPTVGGGASVRRGASVRGGANACEEASGGGGANASEKENPSKEVTSARYSVVASSRGILQLNKCK